MDPFIIYKKVLGKVYLLNYPKMYPRFKRAKTVKFLEKVVLNLWSSKGNGFLDMVPEAKEQNETG